ncbi:MAG: hypothetical protein WKG03_02870 [Telluria sp.]
MGMPKKAHNWTGFSQRPNQANFHIGTAQLSDLAGVFIPGITLEIEVKTPIVAQRCLMFFTLRQRALGARPRLYQLEVCPTEKRSHNGDPVIYGPHEHFLETDVSGVSEIGVNCDDWDGALKWFLSRVNVIDLEVPNPC